MSQPNLINKPEVRNNPDEICLTEILREIQATPKQYWTNLLQIMRIFRESVTTKSELLTYAQQDIEIDTQHQELLKQQHQGLKQLTEQWLEEGEQQDQTETWEYLRQAIDDNPF